MYRMAFKFGAMVPNSRIKIRNVGGFKFGSVVQYHHTYIRFTGKDLILSVVARTAKCFGYTVVCQKISAWELLLIFKTFSQHVHTVGAGFKRMRLSRKWQEAMGLNP